MGADINIMVYMGKPPGLSVNIGTNFPLLQKSVSQAFS